VKTGATYDARPDRDESNAILCMVFAMRNRLLATRNADPPANNSDVTVSGASTASSPVMNNRKASSSEILAKQSIRLGTKCGAWRCAILAAAARTGMFETTISHSSHQRIFQSSFEELKDS